MHLKKVIASLLLLACAGALAFLVKDAIDVRNPEQAVAKMTVTADTLELPVAVAGFQWEFLFGRRACKKPMPVFEIKLEPAPGELLGGERLELVFSQPAKKIVIKQSKNYSYDFFEVDGDLTVPFESGIYVYKVEAEFESGRVLYYFYAAVT